MKSGGPDGSKADFIRDTVHEHRAAARLKLIEEFPSIAAPAPADEFKNRALLDGVVARVHDARHPLQPDRQRQWSARVIARMSPRAY